MASEENGMTTWFKFADTPPPEGVKCMGVWYYHPPKLSDPIDHDVAIFELPSKRPPDCWNPLSAPSIYVRKYMAGRWYLEQAPRYWAPYTPPEENE